MNVPEGVNTEAENLLSRIGIRDFTFCDQFFVILGFFEKFDIFGKIGTFEKSDFRGSPFSKIHIISKVMVLSKFHKKQSSKSDFL